MPTTSPKKRLFEHFARVAKALSNPHRLEILEALAQGERSVDGLAKAVQLPIANTSHHLQALRDGALVTSRKEGQQVIYALSDDAIPAIIVGIRGVAERHLAEVGRIVRESFESRDELKPVGRNELMQRVQSGEAMVIDVRPASEYGAGHIPGAVNIPLENLSQRLDDLPKHQEIVAYCRGPYCLLAFDAVEAMRKAGLAARRLEDGFPEWKAEQRPIE